MLFPKKTPLMIIALLTGFVVLMAIASNAFIAHSIAQLEQEHARQHMLSVQHLYDRELAGLAAQAADWANWDDTYTFLADHNEEYIESNYPLEMFQTLGLNLAVLTDLSGQVVFSKAYDAQAEREAPPPPSLQGDLLASLLEPPRPLAGLLDLPEGPLLVAAEPILTSTRTGSPRGVLTFGRWLDDDVLSFFEEATGGEIALVPWQADTVPADFAEARQQLSGAETVFARALNDHRIAAYGALYDISGNPTVILRTAIERDIYQHFLASHALYTTLLIMFTAVMGLVIILLVWQMKEQGQELSDILNGSADPIVVVTADGTILKANIAFETLCGPGQRSLLDVVCPEHPEHQEALQHKLREASTLQTTQTLAEVSFRRQSMARETVEFEVMLSPIRARLKRSPRLIATLHDLALQKQVEAHLRSALNREAEINRLKTQFLSIASHEFRTPLAVILSSTDTLEHYWDRQTEEERHKRFARIKNAVQTMRQLTDDLLVHVRTETGALEVRPEPTDINTLCERLVRELSLSQEKDVPITFQAAPSPLVIQADPNLITLVVRNLLSNAVKYSPAGKTVSLSVAQEAERTTLTIRDEGIGIPLEEQSHLFTPFFRASNVDTIAGSGLGLSIIKKAVELQGGTISFESVPGQGTTFRVTLPHHAPAVAPGNGNGHTQALPVAPQN